MQNNITRDGDTYRYYVILLLLFVLLAGCRKTGTPLPVPVEPKSDAKSIRLKQLLVEKLPAPYFHFTYSNEGFADSISFADGFFIYKVHYVNKRVSKLHNNINNADLIYQYNAKSQVNSIVENDMQQKKIRRYSFAYNSKGQLTKVTWWLFPANRSDSTREREVELEYYPDGNLSKFKDDRFHLATGVVGMTTTTEYSDYDDGKNADEFYLLKDTWTHLLYLPQVTLQKNNARHVLIKGDVNDYEIMNVYSYNTDGLPLRKDIRMEQIRGENAGTVLKFANHYSYY